MRDQGARHEVHTAAVVRTVPPRGGMQMNRGPASCHGNGEASRMLVGHIRDATTAGMTSAITSACICARSNRSSRQPWIQTQPLLRPQPVLVLSDTISDFEGVTPAGARRACAHTDPSRTGHCQASAGCNVVHAARPHARHACMHA